MLKWLLAFACFYVLPGYAGSAIACAAASPCEISQGHYFLKTPAGWNGISPLPVIVHFHGFREEAQEIIRRSDVAALADGHDKKLKLLLNFV